MLSSNFDCLENINFQASDRRATRIMYLMHPSERASIEAELDVEDLAAVALVKNGSKLKQHRTTADLKMTSSYDL